MIVKLDIRENTFRMTELSFDGIEYKRIEYMKDGETLDIQWSVINHVSDHLDFDDILNDSDSMKLERILFEYRTLNKITENESLILE